MRPCSLTQSSKAENRRSPGAGNVPGHEPGRDFEIRRIGRLPASVPGRFSSLPCEFSTYWLGAEGEPLRRPCLNGSRFGTRAGQSAFRHMAPIKSSAAVGKRPNRILFC